MNNEIIKQSKGYARHFYYLSKQLLCRNELSPKRFIIYGRDRSGSTLLISLLDSLPGVFSDGEILNYRVIFPYAHILAKCSISNASVYGCKILSYQLRDFQPIRERGNFIKTLYDIHNFKIIYLNRENLLYYAVSNIRARIFGFHNTKVEKQEIKR